MLFFYYLATFVAIAHGKCRSKCKAEYVDCIALHGEDVETKVLDACIRSSVKEGEEDTVCTKCLKEHRGKEVEPASVQRQFICLPKCKWVAIGCTQAGINASNLLRLMECVSSSYDTPLMKKKAPLCGKCIKTGECATFCNDRKEGEEPCTDEEITAVMGPCQEAKAKKDHCSQNNVRNCESLPICQLCNGECVKATQQCKEEEGGEGGGGGGVVTKPTPAPAKMQFFKDKAAYFRYCKVTFKGKGKEMVDGCKKCGGKPQMSKGGCKVREDRAACNQISDKDICKKAKCKPSFNDKAKTEFKRCVNPPEGQESIFGPPGQQKQKKSRRRRGGR